MKKRLITLLLAVLLILSVTPAVFAADTTKAVTLADKDRKIVGEYDTLDTAFKAAIVNKLSGFVLHLNEDITVDKTISLLSIDALDYTIEGAGHRITQQADAKNTLVIGGNSNTKVTIKDLELFGTKSALVVNAGKIDIWSGRFSATSYTFDTTVDINPAKECSVICNIMGGVFESKTPDLTGADTRMAALRVTNIGNSSTDGVDTPSHCNIYGGYFRSELSNFTVFNCDYAVTKVYGGTFFNNKSSGYTLVSSSGNALTKTYVYGGTFILGDGATATVIRNNKAGGEMYVYGGSYVGGSGMFRNVGSGTSENSSWGTGNPARGGIAVPIMSSGAGVRLVENSAGLAFYTTVDKATIDAVKERADAGTALKLGAIIVNAADVTALPTITADVLDAAGVKYQDITATGDYDFSNAVSYAVAIKNVSAENAAKRFAAIPYITATINGVETRFYGMYDVANARSMAEVATAALADTETSYTLAQQAILNAYVGN